MTATQSRLPSIGPCAECGAEIKYGEGIFGGDQKLRHAQCPSATIDKVMAQFGYTRPYCHQVLRWIPIIEAVIAAERDRCAKIAEGYGEDIISNRVARIIAGRIRDV